MSVKRGEASTYDEGGMRQYDVLERPRRRAGEGSDEVEHGVGWLYTAIRIAIFTPNCHSTLNYAALQLHPALTARALALGYRPSGLVAVPVGRPV